MPADRYRVQLYSYSRLRHEEMTNLDPKSDTRLRELLEEFVQKVRGTLKLDLSAGWELRVRIPNGVRIVARCWTSPTGRTVVKR